MMRLFSLAMAVLLLANGSKAMGQAASRPDLKGMCLKENENEDFVERGWCKTIFETIGGNKTEPVKPGCTDDLFKKLHQKVKKNEAYIPGGCSEKVTKDDAKFKNLVAQYVSAMAAVTTNWKSSETGEQRGVLPMTTATAKQFPCGCEKITDDKITLEDENLSSKCVTYIILRKLTDEAKGAEQGKGFYEKISPLFGNKFKPDANGQNRLIKKIEDKMYLYCEKVERGGAKPLDHTLQEDGATTRN